MPLFTVEQARQHLDAWLAAELAISTGQSYTIGTRSLTRANIKEVMNQIRYWQGQHQAAENAAAGLSVKRKVRRYLPLDL